MASLKTTLGILYCVSAGYGAVKNVIMGSVRPYPRSMIESISPTLPTPFSTTSKDCSPAQSPPSFVSQQKDYTLHSLSDTRLFLQGLEYASRKDDMRRAYEMRKAWIESIWTELRGIRLRLVKQVLERDSIKSAVDAMASRGIDSPSVQQNPVLDITVVEQNIRRNFAEETEMGEPARSRNPSDAPKFNTREGWKSLKEHHSVAKGSIQSVIDAIIAIDETSFRVFNEHNKIVAQDPGYQLKWPSFITQADLNAITADVTSIESVGKVKYEDFDFYRLDKTLSSALGKVSLPGGDNVVTPLPPSLDQFVSDNVQTDLEKIAGLVLSDGSISSQASASLPAASFSQRMSVLNAKLNWLNSLRLGNEDAQNSLLDLIHRVKVPMEDLVKKIEDSLKRIREGLASIDDAVWKVYYDAHGFTSEVSTDLSPDFDKAIDHLSNAIQLKNNHASLPGRTKYILDTVKIMHSSLIALVDAHADASVTPSITGDAKGNVPVVSGNSGLIDPIRTQLLKVSSNNKVQEVPKPFTKNRLDDPEKLKLDIAKLAENAEKTSKCILYGRVDGAQIFDKLTPEPAADVCAEAHAYGNDVIKTRYDEYVASLGSSKPPAKDGAPPGGDHVDALSNSDDQA